MARELSEDDYQRWHEKFEQKKTELDEDNGTVTAADHDGGTVLLGDRSDGADEWLRYEREERDEEVITR